MKAWQYTVCSMDRQGWGTQRKRESLGWARDFLEEAAGRILPMCQFYGRN